MKMMMNDDDPNDGSGPSASLHPPHPYEEMSRQQTDEIQQQSDDILALINTGGSSHREEDDDDVQVGTSRQGLKDDPKCRQASSDTYSSKPQHEAFLLSDGAPDMAKYPQNPKKHDKQNGDNDPSSDPVESSGDSQAESQVVDGTTLIRSSTQYLMQPGAYRVAPAASGLYDVTTAGDPSCSSDNVVTREHEPLPTRDTTTIQAIKVEPDVEEQRIRNQILNQAVQADIVVSNDNQDDDNNKQCRWSGRKILLLLIALLLVIAVVVGVAVGSANSSNSNDEMSGSNTKNNNETNVDDSNIATTPTPVRRPTLESVQEAGILRCGIPDFAIFYDYDEQGNRLGLDVDLCHAMAAAILGDPSKVEFVPLQLVERFIGLTNGTVDIYARAAPTMERDIYEQYSMQGVTFTMPYNYGGVVFGGLPDMVACADALNTQGGVCSTLQVCVGEGTTYQDRLERVIPKSRVVPLPASEILSSFLSGDCNAVVGIDWDLRRLLVVKQVLGPGYVTGQTALYYEGLSMVTRDDDAEWSDMINMVLQSLFLAEEQGITESTASHFMTTHVFGENYADIFINAIAARGNYGELYEKYYEPVVPRRTPPGINQLNNGSTPLLRSPEIGVGVSDLGPEPFVDGLLEQIINRGYLICGISDIQTGFAEYDADTERWIGLDVDFCRALAASLFFGSTSFDETLQFIELNDESGDGYVALSKGEVDVLAGVGATLETEVLEPSSGHGFAFSIPYFYHNITKSRSLATQQIDRQWSSFVNWVVASTIYAEANGISKETSNDMPEIGMFGDDYRRMFRDSILAVGHYGDIYDRNLQSIFIPRSTLNQLNSQNGPQLRPIAF